MASWLKPTTDDKLPRRISTSSESSSPRQSTKETTYNFEKLFPELGDVTVHGDFKVKLTPPDKASLQGRLFVTPEHLAFYSTSSGKEVKRLTIRLDGVSSISREKGIITQETTVKVGTEEVGTRNVESRLIGFATTMTRLLQYIFSNNRSRDTFFQTLQGAWTTAAAGARKAKAASANVLKSAGGDLASSLSSSTVMVEHPSAVEIESNPPSIAEEDDGETAINLTNVVTTAFEGKQHEDNDALVAAQYVPLADVEPELVSSGTGSKEAEETAKTNGSEEQSGIVYLLFGLAILVAAVGVLRRGRLM
ncbi:hypothetical protein BJ742DRAFT_893983 [Cladochytrium replicatum]|nr:hypothetical protein BJ742DRAFT_893983 [Cladochytrium replicatum]